MKKNIVVMLTQMRNKVLVTEIGLTEEQKELAGDRVSLFFLREKVFIEKAWERWGLCSKNFKFVDADCVRLAFIMTHPLNREDIEILLGIVCKDAAQLDAASASKNAIWSRLAVLFNDIGYMVLLSVMAKEICTRNNIDPNDRSRRALARTGKWLEKCWGTSSPHYKEAFRKWTLGTGGGPSSEDLFSGGWNDQRADGDFQNYDKSRRAWLAVFYCLDKANGFVLLQRQASVPDSVGETGMLGTSTDGNSNSNTSTKKIDKKLELAFSSFEQANKTMQTILSKLFTDDEESSTSSITASVSVPVAQPVVDISRLENRVKMLEMELQKAYVNESMGEAMKSTWIRNLLDQKMKTIMEM